MSKRVARADLDVAAVLAAFVEKEALPGTGMHADGFWRGISDLVRDLAPRNRELLAVRDRLQSQIDEYHRANPGAPDAGDYRAFLEQIEYLLPAPEDTTVSTEDVDDEIRAQAGPQLVVPLLNSRFAVNAANARWGSLYDALYGTDAIPDDGETALGEGYNAARGAEAIRRGRRLLDLVAPLTSGTHADASAYRVVDRALVIETAGSGAVRLAAPAAFAGFRGAPGAPSAVLLEHHGLHVEVVIDRSGPVGRTDPAGVQDVLLESAVTTIMDLEDSVAAVDADDKVVGYRNWRDLMRGTLSAEVVKAGRTFTRTLADDRRYSAPGGDPLVLPGRSLLLVRNVGHLMTTDAILDADGREVPEGILDAVMTALGALPDLVGEARGRNSRAGSLYIVKPKMHGPDEVSFAVELFARVEALLGIAPRTIKLGLMDEERRTSVNLAACIARASDRIVFINTGFLDRTGDEIRTSLHAGPVMRKQDLRTQPFIAAYEDANVLTGLHAGFGGRAQIGKGMWAMPDLMHEMLVQKEAHVRSGATAAWVPSPTAATLHALHYHHVDAFAVQAERMLEPRHGIEEMLAIPLAVDGALDRELVATEVDTNVQSILGYVVRWVDQGIGCSKVLDIHDVALMEDRATLRISSQLLSSWLTHGVIDEAVVLESLVRLAPVVDRQNAGDPAYEPLIGSAGPGPAFEAARALIVEGAIQPNGYTEPILHRVRRARKRMTAAGG